MNARTWPDHRARWLNHDRAWALRFNRAAALKPIYFSCRLASRLGDGLLWYGLIIVLPWFNPALGMRCAVHMTVAGLVSLICYLMIKNKLGRPRPYATCKEIALMGRPLDPYSFPSGHTQHAVGFSLVLLFYFPALAIWIVPLTLAIALSRLVLGLHYPSDVIAGALFGAFIAWLSLAWL